MKHRFSQVNFLSKKLIIFLTISLNMCCGYSKEPSNPGGSLEHSQCTLWLRNNKIDFHSCTIILRPMKNLVYNV